MNKLFLSCCFLLMTAVSFGQLKPDTTREDLSSFCDKFMQTFVANHVSEAIQSLRINSTLDGSFVDNLDKSINQQMNNVKNSYKKMVGYDFVEEKAIKDVLVRRRYILKFELYFLTFDFYLYNNGSRWSISGFFYKDDQKELF